MGAVYMPVLEMLPPEAAQVTPVFLVPLTDAENDACFPVKREVVTGESETETVLSEVENANIEATQVEYLAPVDHAPGKDNKLVC